MKDRFSHFFLIVSFVFLMCINASAQIETEFIVNPAGTNGTGNYSVSIGEPVVGFGTGASVGFLSSADTLTTNVSKIETVENAFLKIFPNPSNSTLNFSSQQLIVSIFLFDAQGKEVLSESFSALQTSLNVSALQKGIYLGRVVFANDQSQLIKIIKE